ncbi:MAG: SDR family oxidoreductase [Dehalococcoidales bacterium]|nr:MAG: SDR family oxidoreductase [Dehalococcoidales bacterium]
MLCKGKTAIITGAAGKGMGRSIALTFAREGATVVVNYLSSENEASAIVDYIKSRGGMAIAVQSDISKHNDCQQMCDIAQKELGPVDICIISPGSGWHTETIDNLDISGSLDDVNREIAPVYNLMSLVLPGMYARNWGRIIGISMNFSGNSPSYAYDVAKKARTQAILRASSDAWSHGVTANVIAPGPVTEIQSLDEAIELCNHGEKWEKRNNVTPQDIAEGVAFLCSEAGRFITGCELPYAFY